jgi:hypothetical protein
MKNFKTAAALLIVTAISLAAFTACKTPKLAAGGAYTSPITNTVGTNIVITSQSDLALYTADASFDLAYTTINSVFLIERNNRDYFWKLSPQIKRTVDKIRPIAQQVVNDYSAARTAYLANTTPAGLSGIQAILAKLQQLVFAATAAVGQQTNPPTNAVPPAAEAPDTTK